MFLIAGGSFTFAYLTGTNWDYRLILLIPCAMAFAAYEGSIALSRVLLWASVAVLFCSYPVGRLQIVGDIVLAAFVPVLVLLLAATAFPKLSKSRHV